jgi:hypothetical protein
MGKLLLIKVLCTCHVLLVAARFIAARFLDLPQIDHQFAVRRGRPLRIAEDRGYLIS